ncbi:unnamed protein product [Lactuca virosa]|uniref:HAT C-terminal dimerisation domain-containing protein n=1 Tax=Lactuca virosa TaxID=75947 RepID=A0AAU9P612_9ASTR|nr:unnamed protein product [Lactuca virosa]
MANPMKIKLKNIRMSVASKIHGSLSVSYVENVRSALIELFNEYDECLFHSKAESIPCFCGSSSEVHFPDDELCGFDSWYETKKSNVVATSKTELELYLIEPLFQRSDSFNILDRWKANSAKHPTLAKIARDILVVPATSVAYEASFNNGGRIINECGSFLTLKTVEALVTTQD